MTSNPVSTLAPEASEQKRAGTPTTDCPYPGLRAFFTEERNWYFGREEHVDAMLSRLESNRFLAVVGSSGSGKSSLVFAGLIPALREGQLAGPRRNSEGDPARWVVISFHPGNDPLEELAAAILRAAAKPDDPHLAGYIRAALDGGEQGLMEALSVAGCLGVGFETLVYADQFEELFRFGEKTGRAAQEKALQFARLFVVAALQKEVRLHVLLSMRSEFIGECERFPGLPEIVSASQFLTPRLSRKQMEQSLRCPAEAVGGKIEPDALTAILNDCGISPDPLPLAQHVLRRMWKRASREFTSRVEKGGATGHLLTLEDYTTVGGIRDSLAQHGDEILKTLPQPDGTEVARLLFMSMCEQRDEGPLVRRLSSRSEVEAITGDKAALVPTVITAFGTDDPGFIREDKGWLDVRHEAILRQWPLISEWRKRETGAEGWLRDLAQAARDYEEDPTTELWRGNDLRGAGEWMHKEKPTEAWAKRHGVNNWDKCLHFLELSRQAEGDSLREKRINLRMAREEKERRQRIWINVTGGIALVFFVAGVFMTNLWKSAKQSEARSTSVIRAFAQTADALAPPIAANAKSALAEAEQQTAKITKILWTAGVASPPDRATINDLVSTREVAERAADAMENLANSMKEVARITNDNRLNAASTELGLDATEIRDRRKALQKHPEAWKAIDAAFEIRLKEAERDLAGLNANQLDTDLVKEKRAKEIPAATANFSALEAIGDAAEALGFDGKDFQPFEGRYLALYKTLEAIQKLSLGAAAPLTTWKLDVAVALPHAGKVNRVRFVTGSGGSPLIISAGEDRLITVWSEQGRQLGKTSTSSAINDISVSEKAMAIAAASNGSTVRVLRWTDLSNLQNIKVDAFERHSDSVTDVEFSHGGERVASGSADRTVRVFDSHTLAQLYFTSPPLPGIVTSVAFHPGDNLVVSGCDDGGVRLHTIDQPSVQLLGEKMGAPARRPEFSSDGQLVIAASGDMTARVWTIVEPREIVNLVHPAPVTQATFRPLKGAEGYTFVTCATNGEVRFAQMTSNTAENSSPPVTVLEPRHPGAVLSASWSADGRWLATVGGSEVLVWDWASDSPIARVRLGGLHKDTSRAEFSADAKLLATYGGDNTAYVWDLTKIPEQ